MRRTGWECAASLLSDFTDRLTPRAYSVCLAAFRAGPDAICVRRARRVHRLYRRLVEIRQ
ncbi:hypothetical protein M0638_28150 [Roseomonas sp. NAR14]|uniref:Uncharacterized protein n=1 Tax=Roseomonas acroporae TaxID=2937791 RepID=A0A9X1YE87_9PROT|nr:hypothetical protein [Roseomonas acroporae]MCK8788227.1 hypothetical protein [Roseomonas acroporae]